MKTNASYESVVTVRYKMDRSYDSPKGCVFMEICEVPVLPPGYARLGPSGPDYASPSVPGQLAGNPRMVEAGGQHIPRLSLRAGLCLHPYCSVEHSDAERVIRPIESARS
jgi:hypothetical protein